MHGGMHGGMQFPGDGKSAIVQGETRGCRMVRRSSAKAVGAAAGRLLCVLALGLLLAGCDRCADWWWAPSQNQVCKSVPAR